MNESEKMIRIELIRRGWSMKDLTNETGLSYQTVMAVVVGRNTRESWRYAVAKALDLHPDLIWYKWGGDGIMTSAEKEIRVAMLRKGWTMVDLAQEIGVSRQAAWAVVTGRTTRRTARYALAAALDLHPDVVWPEPGVLEDA